MTVGFPFNTWPFVFLLCGSFFCFGLHQTILDGRMEGFVDATHTTTFSLCES